MNRRLCLFVLAAAALFIVPACAETIQIVVIGDSNIAGRGVASSENYPSKLERALRAKGRDVHVVNEGINGDTVPGVRARLDSAVPAGTKLAIVWVGINDLRKGVSAAQVESGRQAIAAHLRARGIKVLMLGPRHGLAGQPQYLTGDQQQHLKVVELFVVWTSENISQAPRRGVFIGFFEKSWGAKVMFATR